MITGVVLCGGNSTRMGTDKGLLQYASQTWAQLAFNKLQALDIPVVISINPLQHITYQTFFSEELLTEDNFSLHIGGPLKGILSAHLQHPNHHLLVLAVDMVNMNNFLLKQLLSYKQYNAEAIVYRHQLHIEPLCGLYKAEALQKIMQLYRTNRLKKHSMHFILEQLQTVYIDVPPHDEARFDNFNSAGDLVNLSVE